MPPRCVAGGSNQVAVSPCSVSKSPGKFDLAAVAADDVGSIDEIDDGQPGLTLVDGVFDRAEAVLVLFVEAVEGEVNIGLIGEVKVGGLEEQHLALSVTITGVAEQDISLSQALDPLSVDDVGGIDTQHAMVVIRPFLGIIGIAIGHE